MGGKQGTKTQKKKKLRYVLTGNIDCCPEQQQEKEDEDIFAKTNSLSLLQINPQGTLKRGWDFLIIIILLYTAIIAPYNTAFIKDVDISPG